MLALAIDATYECQMNQLPEQTEVFDSYWRFAAERLAIYYRRLDDPVGPWTDDPVLSEHRFTNTYRAADRVSQYLIREVQYREDRSQAPAEVFFRTMLFKIFNRIETWEAIEARFGPLSWQSADLDSINIMLDELISSGIRIYSAAYIMPSPAFGLSRKHSNHLALIKSMMDDGLSGRISRSPNLKSAYEMILSYPGLGPFLAFQYAIDLNYSTLIDFDENDFVVAGPGALDGISKCFRTERKLEPAAVIHLMVEQQDQEFKRLNLDFGGLFGRSLKPIDCQNLFCEISKYARAAHPNVPGISGRTRIKQKYDAGSAKKFVRPFFPPKWNLVPRQPRPAPVRFSNPGQQLTLI